MTIRHTTKRVFEAWTSEQENKLLNTAASLLGNWSIDYMVKFAALQFAEAVVAAGLPPEEREKLK